MAVKRRTGIFGIVLLLVLFASGAFVVLRLMLAGGGPSFAVGGRVAVIPVIGFIESERRFVEQIERLRNDGSVRAFLIEIRSGGGRAAPSQAMYETLRELRDEEDRPVVAWIGETGASGGYYVALAADSILAMQSSVTGSIGVVLAIPNAGEFMQRWGFEMDVLEAGENKDMGGYWRGLEEEERRILQTLIDDLHGQFVDAVAASRPLDRDSVRVLADGRVLSGERAARAGLIDRTATLDEALDVAGRMAGLGENPRTLRVEEPAEPLLERLLTSRVGDWLERLGLSLSPALPASGTPSLRYEWR